MITLFFFWSRYFKKICLVESTTTETVDRRIVDASGNYVKNDAGEYETEKVTSVIVKGQDIQDGAVAGYRIIMIIALVVGTIPGWVFLA
ncbi:hypothetical protein D3C86_1549360 [compost metagenome]